MVAHLWRYSLTCCLENAVVECGGPVRQLPTPQPSIKHQGVWLELSNNLGGPGREETINSAGRTRRMQQEGIMQ